MLFRQTALRSLDRRTAGQRISVFGSATDRPVARTGSGAASGAQRVADVTGLLVFLAAGLAYLREWQASTTYLLAQLLRTILVSRTQIGS